MDMCIYIYIYFFIYIYIYMYVYRLYLGIYEDTMKIGYIRTTSTDDLTIDDGE